MRVKYRSLTVLLQVRHDLALIASRISDSETNLVVVAYHMDIDKIPSLPDAPNAVEKGPEKVPEGGDQVMQDANSDEDVGANTIVYFRVHKSLLMGESTMLEEIIEKNSDDGLNKYDGVPVITLGDKAKDVRGFLRAIYKP